MAPTSNVIHEVPGLYRVVRFTPFRQTKAVAFDLFPLSAVPRIDAIDRVMHGPGAFSPGSVGGVVRPWYMHPHQDDHLIVLHGTRDAEIYTPAHGKVERFVVEPDRIEMNGEVLYDGPAFLAWPCGVFHRVESGPVGSATINFATHYEGFDINTNFNIYDLNPDTGAFRCVREGHLDQGGRS